MWIETELGIAGDGKNSSVELEQLFSKTLPCFQNFKYLGEFQWWLNQKATMSRIVSTKNMYFSSTNHRFQPRWKNSQPTNFCIKDISDHPENLTNLSPARRCESNTQWPDWQHLVAPLHRCQGRNNGPEGCIFPFWGGESWWGIESMRSIVVYLWLSIHIRLYL